LRQVVRLILSNDLFCLGLEHTVTKKSVPIREIRKIRTSIRILIFPSKNYDAFIPHSNWNQIELFAAQTNRIKVKKHTFALEKDTCNHY
jgi:hypothetical protein